MADEETTEQTTETMQTQEPDELARTKREKDDAFRLLRDRDKTLRITTSRLEQLENEMRELKTQRQPMQITVNLADEPEPDIDQEPTKWLKWSRAKDLREREIQNAQSSAQMQQSELNTFALAAEAAAKAAHPDYDQALEWLRQDYRKELEATGELDEAAMAAMNDPSQRQNIANHALTHGLSDVEAARDMVALGAFEWRRQQIVKAARRTNANPAIKAVELAQRRGYKAGANGSAKNVSQVDASLAEMERKRNLKAAGQSLSETKGGEPHDKRVWTRAELEDLQKSNPGEFRRAIKEIAGQADEGDPRDVLGDLITR